MNFNTTSRLSEVHKKREALSLPLPAFKIEFFSIPKARYVPLLAPSATMQDLYGLFF